jgi:FMN phosphatase YigB (HAD superfamily)
MLNHLQKLLLSLLLLPYITYTDNFIFDLGGVLIDTDSMASMNCIGIKNIAQCMFHLKKSPFSINNHLKRKLFDILDEVAFMNKFESKPTEIGYDEQGNQLPHFMCAWLAGTMSSQSIRSHLLSAIHNHPEWFDHTAEKKAIVNLITMIFTPKQFVETRKIYVEGIAFIKACKNKGHRIYALSNWDAESFALLKEKFSYLFDLFDGIIISGITNTVKPSPTIYSTLLRSYDLNPKKCWFIDDQKENVVAAHQAGINAIVCPYKWPLKKPDFHKITVALNKAHKSVTRREKRKNSGTRAKKTKKTSMPIIDGENISETELT